MKCLLILILFASCKMNTPESAKDASLSCESPDAPVNCCFDDMPGQLTSAITIAPGGEAGQPLQISGRLFHKNGRDPFAGVKMYFYHTDHTGRYTKTGDEKGIRKWHGRLHGWLVTDDSGRYSIQTIRPASYPNSTIPAHIHSAVMEPSGDCYYLSDFVFEGDPFLDSAYFKSLEKWKLAGDSGMLALNPIGRGWSGKRDIRLLH